MTNYIQVDEGGGRQRSVPVELPANSYKSRKAKAEEKKKIDPVVTGKVITKKPSVWASFRHAMEPQEAAQSVWMFIVMEVLVPAAKNMLSDAVSQGVDRALYGEVRVRPARDRPGGGTISYHTIRRASPAPEYSTISARGRARHDFSEVIVASRGEAEEVLEQLKLRIAEYGVATVADFYDLVGITGEFTDNKWGWAGLGDARVRMIRGGYLIVLPDPRPID